MEERKSNQFKLYIQDTALFNSMRVDLLRAGIMSLSLVIVFLVFILYARNQDNGLHTYSNLLSGIVGLLILLNKPGRPAQFNRITFGVPKEFTDYEKKLEFVMLHLRKRIFVAMATVPYFVWLLYLMANNETPIRNDFTTLFLSSFFSFFMTLMLSAGAQYFQIWYSLGQERNIHYK